MTNVNLAESILIYAQHSLKKTKLSLQLTGKELKTNKVDFNVFSSIRFVLLCAIYCRNNLFFADISRQERREISEAILWRLISSTNKHFVLDVRNFLFTVLRWCLSWSFTFLFFGRKVMQKNFEELNVAIESIFFCPIYWFHWVIKKRKLGYYLIEDVGIDEEK